MPVALLVLACPAKDTPHVYRGDDPCPGAEDRRPEAEPIYLNTSYAALSLHADWSGCRR